MFQRAHILWSDMGWEREGERERSESSMLHAFCSEHGWILHFVDYTVLLWTWVQMGSGGIDQRITFSISSNLHRIWVWRCRRSTRSSICLVPPNVLPRHGFKMVTLLWHMISRSVPPMIYAQKRGSKSLLPWACSSLFWFHGPIWVNIVGFIQVRLVQAEIAGIEFCRVQQFAFDGMTGGLKPS